jgi:hypothetical protein
MHLALLPDACYLSSLLFTGRTSQLSVSSLPRFLLQKLSISQNPWQIDGTMIGSISQLEPIVDLQLDLWEVSFDKMEQPRNTVALKTLSLTGSLQSMSGFMTKFPIAPRSLSSVHFNPVSFLVTSEGFIHPFGQHSDHIPAQFRMSFSLTRGTQNICFISLNSYVTRHSGQNVRKFSHLSRVTEGIFEYAKQVTKSAKNDSKVKFSRAQRVLFQKAPKR